MGPRAGLDAVEERKISCSCRESNHGRPARSPLLYPLSYPASQFWNVPKKYKEHQHYKFQQRTSLVLSSAYFPIMSSEFNLCANSFVEIMTVEGVSWVALTPDSLLFAYHARKKLRYLELRERFAVIFQCHRKCHTFNLWYAEENGKASLIFDVKLAMKTLKYFISDENSPSLTRNKAVFVVLHSNHVLGTILWSMVVSRSFVGPMLVIHAIIVQY
jgi:hypothetical protein